MAMEKMGCEPSQTHQSVETRLSAMDRREILDEGAERAEQAMRGALLKPMLHVIDSPEDSLPTQEASSTQQVPRHFVGSSRVAPDSIQLTYARSSRSLDV